MKFFNENTPIERYVVNGDKIVFIKREDLCTNYPLPPLEKLRGVRKFLEKVKARGATNLIGVFDTRVSKAGWGVSVLCEELGLNCLAAFPVLKNDTERKLQQVMAESHGAELLPLKAGRTAILYAKTKRLVEERSGLMLPLGLVCGETVEEVARVASETPLEFESVVICVGTGTITAGVLAGLRNRRNVRVFGVSCGMSHSKQLERIQRKLVGYGLSKFEARSLIKNKLILQQAEFSDYYEPDFFETPVAMHPYYDSKAWRWLIENYDSLRKPVLFWLIGS